MKIIGINGSPRKNGNTAKLVENALQGASETGASTELIHLSELKYTGCTGCEGCRGSFKCVIQDDMQMIYSKLLESDGLICGSPTYFYNVTAIMKAFIDRCYCLEEFDPDDRSRWVGAIEAAGGKYASVIAVCEQHKEEDMGFAPVAMSMSLEALGYRIVDVVRAVGFFAPESVETSEDLLKKARDAGARLAGTVLLRKQLETKISD